MKRLKITCKNDTESAVFNSTNSTKHERTNERTQDDGRRKIITNQQQQQSRKQAPGGIGFLFEMPFNRSTHDDDDNGNVGTSQRER